MMKCDECLYTDISNWDKNEDGTAKAILWCEKYRDFCDDVVSNCNIVVYEEEENGK